MHIYWIFLALYTSIKKSLISQKYPCWGLAWGHIQFISVQFSHPVRSNSLRPHGLQHARPPCLSPTPRVYSNSCLSRLNGHWVNDTIQPSHPLSSPSPPTFNFSQHQSLFKWVSPSHQVAEVLGVSASASVLPMNIQDWFPLGWTGWIS